MRNHWLKVHRSKNNNFNTVEFMDSGYFVLKPRKVQIETFNSNSSNQGKIGLNFQRALLASTTDMEIISFLSKAKNSMSSWLCRLRYYQFTASSNDVFTQTKFCEINKLSFDNLVAGINMQDAKLFFNYADIKHYNTI